MKRLAIHPSPDHLKVVESSSEYTDFMTKYEAFTKSAFEGGHGSTAKYWMMYMKLVSIYLKFSRACRTNNLQLFIDALKDTCPIFFAMNRPNYARWMVRYYLNLINIEETHTGMKSALEGGTLSIRRTNKNFSRTPVDMTLEQTINADAASRQTGIVAFNNSESARRRWMLTRSMRSCIVGGLLDKAGLKTTDDIAGTLRNSRIRRDNEDVQTVADKIVTTLNPFDIEQYENLYCLTTGKQCNTETRNDLLNCITLSEKWKAEFLNGCFTDPFRFEKAIPRRKVRNFASDALKTKVTSKDKKIVELQGTRDLFGRLLYISTINNIDLYKVFQYPLVPVPLSLGHIDGSINKTDKSILMRKLDHMCEGPVPSKIDATFVDAVFFLHTLTSVPITMGELSRMILQTLCNMSVLVHFVCDTYITPSIKDIERTRRGQSYSGFFAERNGEVSYEEKQQYCCKHEEADTRLIYHLNICLKENNNNICCAIRSNDTDVLILLLYHLSILEVADIWMDVGLSRKNTRRYVHVGSVNEKLGAKLANALPGLHAFTGCDYTASFMSKGKMKPFEIMMKYEIYIEAFGTLGESFHVSDGSLRMLEAFVCKLYGKPAMSEVNALRLVMFQENYSCTANGPLDRIKGLNPSTMPPCQKVLQEKMNRANYVTAIWNRAREKHPVKESPEVNGWFLDEGVFSVKWFNGDQLPESIVDLLVTEAVQNPLTDDDATNETCHGLDSSDESDSDIDVEEDIFLS